MCREVKRIFDDYKENLEVLKYYKTQQIKTEAISLERTFKEIKVQESKSPRQEKKMIDRIARTNSHLTAINRLQKENAPIIEVMNKMKTISKSEHALLVMRYVRSYSVDYIAKQMNVSRTTISSRLNKADNRFLKLYECYKA